MTIADSFLSNFFLAPARMAVEWLQVNYPQLVALMGLGNDYSSPVALVVLAGCFWLFFFISAWLAAYVARQITRLVSAAFLRCIYRIRLSVGEWKTAVICHFYRDERPEPGPMAVSCSSVTFSDFDLAVLHAAAKLGPAESISAPDLAAAFRLQAAPLQVSLEKLARNKLLDYAFGETEGHDNYILSTAGAAYFASVKPDTSAKPMVSTAWQSAI